MTKKEFYDYIDTFSDKDLTDNIVLDICKKHRSLKLSDRNWEKLNTALENYKINGEALRTWVKTQLKKNGELPENPSVLKDGQTVAQLTDSEVQKKVEAKEQMIREERYKLQTLTLHQNRAERQESRKELFYELIGDRSKIIEPPLVRFTNDNTLEYIKDKKYLLMFGDIHYGAEFSVPTNHYSIDECKKRFQKLLNETINFIKYKEISEISILDLGDDIQGILRMSDLQINQMPVVDALISVVHLIASFLNEISTYCDITYYHTCYANHSQTRPLGSQANAIADEDMGKIILSYIRDLLKNNKHINVIGDPTNDCLTFDIFNYHCYACHGHTIKNLATALKDLSNQHRCFYDYVLLGHTHSQKEIVATSDAKEDCSYNCEVIVAPSFVGVDPYAESLLVSSKAGAKILGFDKNYGHTESYNIILN